MLRAESYMMLVIRHKSSLSATVDCHAYSRPSEKRPCIKDEVFDAIGSHAQRTRIPLCNRSHAIGVPTAGAAADVVAGYDAPYVVAP